MSEFKTCSNGHNYDSTQYGVCPYCPVANTDADYSRTMEDFKKTILLDETGGSQLDKTIIIEENTDTLTSKPVVDDSQNQLNKTIIVSKNEFDISSPNVPVARRKIVGWLITFSHEECGQDYRLYTGRNKIGSTPNCDIVINDSSVSAEHATILFRENTFFIRDNFSTNGTFINGKNVEDGKLRDGDKLELGNTSFTFKSLY